jgi:hypothetical protein
MLETCLYLFIVIGEWQAGSSEFGIWKMLKQFAQGTRRNPRTIRNNKHRTVIHAIALSERALKLKIIF